MKLTLQKKFFFGIFLVAAVFIGLFATVYTTYYDNYVIHRKQFQLVESYVNIHSNYTQNGTVEYELLQNTELDNGVRIMIVSSAGKIEYNSLLLYSDRAIVTPGFSGGANFKLSELVPQTFGSDAYFEITQDNFDHGYVLFTAGDRTTKIQFLGLLGTIDTSGMVLLQMPTPVIESTNEYTEVFLKLAGFAAITVAMAFGYFMSRKLTKKVSEINEIAEGMAGLDFSKRYTGDADDDVGELGVSINKLSSHLEATIDELKLEIKHAKELEEMRKNLIINISHELKTPIAIIQGYAEGLRVNVTDDENSKALYCDVIEDESKHMARLVGDLLSVSRIEGGAIKPEPAQFEIDELIEGVLISVRVEAKKQNIKMVFAKTNEIAYADESMTEQVLYNYLSNAIDHTAPGGKIEVSCRHKADDILQITVFNEGEAIPEADLSRIWQSFYKVDKARTRAFGGTGIGLSIVKAAMEAQNMDYGVQNIDSGVAFYFDVKLKQTDE